MSLEIVPPSPSPAAQAAPLRAPGSTGDTAPLRRSLTALSWSQAGRRSACLALALLVTAVFIPACLVTAEPVSYDPEQTLPMILPATVSPDPRDVIQIDNVPRLIDISFQILSEDAGKTVKAALYEDYGLENPGGQPFIFVQGFLPQMAPGTLAEGPRTFQGIKWATRSFPLEDGCHRLTLMVTHEFDQDSASGCPKDMVKDTSQVTWMVRKCTEPGAACDNISLADCYKPQVACGGASAEKDAGTGG